MNHLLSQSKNKKILVISFQSLSVTAANNTTNVFELFASFKAANAINQWNISLVQAVQNCVLVGHIDPHVIMLGGSEQYLDVLKLAWMKQILKPPLGFSIQYLGELCNFLVSKTPQCNNSSAELEDALCKCICELVNSGLPSNLKYIMRNITKFLPLTSDMMFTDSDNFLSLDMVNTILDGLQQKGLVYNTGHGYNVMTPDKLLVAKWLGELPDVRQLNLSDDNNNSNNNNNTSNNSNEQKLIVPTDTSNHKDENNTEDCLSCHDLHGYRYLNSSTPNKPNEFNNNDINNIGQSTNNPNIYASKPELSHPIDNNSINKVRMFCANAPKKELPKRPNYVKYESASLMAKIICGMKRLKVHLPSTTVPVNKNLVNSIPVVPNNDINPSEINEDNNNNTHSNNGLNSRLSQSMYAFNRATNISNNNNNNNNLTSSPHPVDLSSPTQQVVYDSHLSPQLDPCCRPLLTSHQHYYNYPNNNSNNNNNNNNNLYSYLTNSFNHPNHFQSTRPFSPKSASPNNNNNNSTNMNYAVFPHQPINNHHHHNSTSTMFIFDDDQRCCSELMLTSHNYHHHHHLNNNSNNNSHTNTTNTNATPYLCSVVPLTQPLVPMHKIPTHNVNRSTNNNINNNNTLSSNSNTIHDDALPAVVAAAATVTHQVNNNNNNNSNTNSNSHSNTNNVNRYLSPFPTCDSGFNSVHGGVILQETEGETIHSKTSSPPDCPKKSSTMTISNYSSNNYSQHLRHKQQQQQMSISPQPPSQQQSNAYSNIFTAGNGGGPCAWQQLSLSLSDNIYKHNFTNSNNNNSTNINSSNQQHILAPVIESSNNNNNNGNACTSAINIRNNLMSNNR